MQSQSSRSCAYCGTAFALRSRKPDQRYCSRLCGRRGGKRRSTPADFWSKVDRSGECWPWTAAQDGHGYGSVRIATRTLKAHRVAWELTNGPIPPGLWVLHHCDNPPCVRPEHLFLGDRSANMADCASKGRLITQVSPQKARWALYPETVLRGERVNTAKLTEAIVREMRERHAHGGITYVDIAVEYGISANAARFAVQRKTWAHVT